MQIIKSAYWKLLLIISDDAYEKNQSKRSGLTLPGCFNETRSIFIHVPKTAGISVATALYGRSIPHFTWRDWQLINPRKFRAFFKFAVLRDPFSRFTSAFDYLKGGGTTAYDKEFSESTLARVSTANDFAKSLKDPAFWNQVNKEYHFMPQSMYVADESGRPQVDLLVRFESLHADFPKIAKAVGREGARLAHLNKTPERKQIDLDAEARSLLGSLYERDFALWQGAGR